MAALHPGRRGRHVHDATASRLQPGTRSASISVPRSFRQGLFLLAIPTTPTAVTTDRSHLQIRASPGCAAADRSACELAQREPAEHFFLRHNETHPFPFS